MNSAPVISYTPTYSSVIQTFSTRALFRVARIFSRLSTLKVHGCVEKIREKLFNVRSCV